MAESQSITDRLTETVVALGILAFVAACGRCYAKEEGCDERSCSPAPLPPSAEQAQSDDAEEKR